MSLEKAKVENLTRNEGKNAIVTAAQGGVLRVVLLIFDLFRLFSGLLFAHQGTL